MLNNFITISEEENREIEKWMLENFNKPNDEPVDILLLILYKIHLLEKRLANVEDQTRTHWAK